MVTLFRSLSLSCNRQCEIHSSKPSALDDLSLTKYLKVYLDGYEDLEQEYLKPDYFNHEHPLILRGYNEDEDRMRCSVCEEDIIPGDEFYRCSVECNFHVHKACVELPRKIRNTLHLAHLLELCRLGSDFDQCNLCERLFLDSSSYKCRLCDFALCVNCAKANIFEGPHGHAEHSFTNIKPTLFRCDACGVSKETEGLSCMCTGCQLQVHKSCSRNSYPFTVKSRVHDHEMSLVYSFQVDLDYAESFCKICFRKMNSVLLMFQCAGCGYLAHANCVMSIMETTNSADKHRSDDAGQIYIPEELLDDALAVKDREVLQVSFLEPKNQIEQRQVVKHFSHPHDLIFGDDEAKLDAICDGCVRPISDPYYTCANEACNFFIHKQCSELPNNIQHPLHPDHPLTLTDDLDLKRCGLLIECYACGYLFNGFAYICRECNFSLDVGCSLLAYTLNHDSHKCTLTLIDTLCMTYSDILNKTKCGACDNEFWCKYICAECVFVVDARCVSLPKTLRHECPKYNWKVMNTSKLLYGAIKDSSGVYYCDVCEERRGENHWYYYCEDCHYNQHPECALGDDLIKYGKVYEIIDHPHPLTLTKVKKTHYCENCGQYCYCSAVLFCGVCDVYLHPSAECCSESYITTVVFDREMLPLQLREN